VEYFTTQQFVRNARGAYWALLLLCVFSIAPAQAQTHDPWSDANERVFKLNDYFDRVVGRSVSIAYTTFIPRIARQGIRNIFSNIDDINVFVNDLLQLKLDAALNDSGRLLVNTTLGLGGILDIASGYGLYKNEEDFGQTLGRWGVAAGPYVMLPVFGASNVRDSFGLVLDTLFNPIQYHRVTVISSCARPMCRGANTWLLMVRSKMNSAISVTSK